MRARDYFLDPPDPLFYLKLMALAGLVYWWRRAERPEA